MGDRDPAPQPSGRALQAFKRDLGLAERKAGDGDAVTSARHSRIDDLDAGTRRAFREEHGAARQLLAESLREGRAMTNLPTGSARVERLARALGMLAFGRPDEAEQLSRPILDGDPRFFPALVVVADAHQLRRDWPASEAIWRELAGALPDDPSYRLALARSLLEQKAASKRTEGEIVLRDMVASGTLLAESARDLVVYLLNQYRASEAEEAVRSAIARLPQDADLRFLLSRALRYQGRLDEAVAELAPLADTPSESQARAIYELVWVHRGQLQFDRAQQRLKDLAEGDFASFMVPRRDALRQLAAVVDEERRAGRRVTWSPLELRSFLRTGTAERDLRDLALRTLARSDVEGVEADLEFVLRSDPDARLRASALAALLERAKDEAGPLETALHDEAPLVRLVAAGRIGQLPASKGKALLYEALVREQDAATFARMHALLEEATGESFFLEAGVAADAARRADICGEWARRLGFEKDRSKGATGG